MQKKVTLMINSTFYDMFGEYLYFIRQVFPDLREICKNHGIDLTYSDVAFSVPEGMADRGIILQDLRCIDSDRTFFICFRGQKLGWSPSPEDIDGLTLDEYPELVGYIGNISITELAVLHALRPFRKFYSGLEIELEPVRHALFYFRNSDYLDDLSDDKKAPYVNKSNGKDKIVLDFEIAKAKDIIAGIKMEFDESEKCNHFIDIRQYYASWDDELSQRELMMDYIREYENLKGMDLSYFRDIHEKYLCEDACGGLGQFTCGGRPLKDVMIEDIMNALKMEFPQNFND